MKKKIINISVFAVGIIAIIVIVAIIVSLARFNNFRRPLVIGPITAQNITPNETSGYITGVKDDSIIVEVSGGRSVEFKISPETVLIKTVTKIPDPQSAKLGKIPLAGISENVDGSRADLVIGTTLLAIRSTGDLSKASTALATEIHYVAIKP